MSWPYIYDGARRHPQSLAHVLAAMAPCARLYAFLGCQLAAARPGATNHKYSRWAATYSGAQYRAWVARKERLLDRCGRGVPFGECADQGIQRAGG